MVHFQLPAEKLYKILAQMPFPVYLTTNYDTLLFNTLKSIGKEPLLGHSIWNKSLRHIEKNIDDTFQPSVNKPIVYHLYGHFNIPESMVLTEDDYIKFMINMTQEVDRTLHHSILLSLSRGNLLFIGYDLEDFGFNTLLKIIGTSMFEGYKETHVCQQILPVNKYKLLIKRELDILKTVQKISSIENTYLDNIRLYLKDLGSLINHEIFDKKNRLEFYKITIKLEKIIADLNISDFERSSLINTVNNLQNQICLIDLDSNKDFSKIEHIERYYSKGLGIEIFWGYAEEFVKELLEKWEQYKDKQSPL